MIDEEEVTGFHAAMTIDARGFPLIAYFSDTAGALKVASCGDHGCQGVGHIVTLDDDGAVGWHVAIGVGAGGLPTLAYYDLDRGDLKVARCGDALQQAVVSRCQVAQVRHCLELYAGPAQTAEDLSPDFLRHHVRPGTVAEEYHRCVAQSRSPTCRCSRGPSGRECTFACR